MGQKYRGHPTTQLSLTAQSAIFLRKQKTLALLTKSTAAYHRHMTYPRSHLVDPEGGVYHVCSRCVRRAFLCGTDDQSGRDFDHRREWIVDRIRTLSTIFAIDILGYAVMSNHYHIVLQVNSVAPVDWADDDIIERWLILNPRKHETQISRSTRKSSLLANPDNLSQYRERLGSLSWFMRYLNEPIARRANQEDQCKGRFWEGRFSSQRLLDDHAVLAAMVYVDLNPLRAGMVKEFTEAAHTSLAQRISEDPAASKILHAIDKPDTALPVSFTLREYLQLVRWTVEAQQSKRPTRPVNLKGLPSVPLCQANCRL